MSGRAWADEPWTKLFTRDSPRWCRLSLAARGLYCLLQRAADRSGRIEGESGEAVADALAHHLRAPAGEIDPPLTELLAAGYVVVAGGWLALPEHIEQQATRSSPAARQRSARALAGGHAETIEEIGAMSPAVTGRHAMSPTVTERHRLSPAVTERHDRSDRSDRSEDRSDRSDQIEQSAGARAAARAEARTSARAEAEARVPSGPTDPRAAAIVAALAAEPRFVELATASVGEALLGSLGVAGLALTPAMSAAAVAAAALELEEGANERRMRQILGWKFRDVLAPPRRGRAAPVVQGAGEDLERFAANLVAGRPAWT